MGMEQPLGLRGGAHTGDYKHCFLGRKAASTKPDRSERVE